MHYPSVPKSERDRRGTDWDTGTGERQTDTGKETETETEGEDRWEGRERFGVQNEEEVDLPA